MEDGSYWLLDPNRYGWEVVRIMSGKVYRFGMEGGQTPEDVIQSNTFPAVYFPITPPASPDE